MIKGLQVGEPYTCYNMKFKANSHEFQTKNRALLPLVYNCTRGVVTSRREPTSYTFKTMPQSVTLNIIRTCPWGNPTIKHKIIWAKSCPVQLNGPAYIWLSLNTAFHHPLTYHSLLQAKQRDTWHGNDTEMIDSLQSMWKLYESDISRTYSFGKKPTCNKEHVLKKRISAKKVTRPAAFSFHSV
jgi:hypothetical protein